MVYKSQGSWYYFLRFSLSLRNKIIFQVFPRVLEKGPILQVFKISGICKSLQEPCNKYSLNNKINWNGSKTLKRGNLKKNQVETQLHISIFG